MTPDEAIEALKFIRNIDISDRVLWRKINEIIETIEKQKKELKDLKDQLYGSMYGIGGYYG